MPGLNSRMHEVHFDQRITHAYFLIDKIGMQLNILLFLTILIDLKEINRKLGIIGKISIFQYFCIIFLIFLSLHFNA